MSWSERPHWGEPAHLPHPTWAAGRQRSGEITRAPGTSCGKGREGCTKPCSCPAEGTDHTYKAPGVPTPDARGALQPQENTPLRSPSGCILARITCALLTPGSTGSRHTADCYRKKQGRCGSSPLNVDTPHPAVPTRIPSALLWA